MDNNDIGRGFDRIVAENSNYYLLAYYPSHPRDGKFHAIDVRVKRSGVKVRARRGYTAPKGDAPAAPVTTAARASSPTLEALNSPIPLSDLRMRVVATPFRAAAQASVVVGIELVGGNLPLDAGGPVEISYLAVDAKGDEHGLRTDRLTMNFEAAMRTRAEQSGVRVLKRMDLPPGRYRLHVAAHDPGQQPVRVAHPRLRGTRVREDELRRERRRPHIQVRRGDGHGAYGRTDSEHAARAAERHTDLPSRRRDLRIRRGVRRRRGAAASG